MDKMRKGQKIIYGYIHSDLLKPFRIVAPDFTDFVLRNFLRIPHLSCEPKFLAPFFEGSP